MARNPRAPVNPDRAVARQKLSDLWNAVLENEAGHVVPEIAALINSQQVSIRFCLPTQLLGKLTDHRVDALCLQKGLQGGDTEWDPRSFASSVVVPWNQSNQNVLGSSGDPYVNNPLRRPRLDDGLAQMRNREEWERLCDVLARVQSADDPAITEQVFLQTLVAIHERLKDLTFDYIVPARVSLAQTENLIWRFLDTRSGGDRGLSVVAALFEAIRDRFGIYSAIRRGVINATDASTNAAGDLECIGADGSVILTVEVKERRITEGDVRIAVAKVRGLSVRELLLCTEGVTAADQSAVEQLLASAWASGTNVYHATIYDLMQGVLPLLGEAGIRIFVAQIGTQLDRFSTQPTHRRAWKDLLGAL